MSIEHPLVKKARFAVGKMTSLTYTLQCVQAQVAAAERECAQALREMEASGEPDEPWAAHWRNNLDCFAETPKTVAPVKKKGKRR
jgi:hypothetical protein